MASRFLLIAASLAASTVAQSTSVTSLFLYGFEGDNIVASVVAAAPQATTYFIGCAAGTDASDCGFGEGVSFTSGPSTLGVHYTEAGAISVDADCSVAANTASCTETDAGSEANFPGTSTTVLSDITDSMAQVTITAGLDLLASGGGSGGGATSTGTGASSSAATSTAEPSSSAASGASKTSGGVTEVSGTASSTSSSSSAAATGAAMREGLNVAAAGLAGFVGVALAL